MKNRKTFLIYIVLCLAIVLTSVATTLALVTDEHQTTDATIKFDKVAIMGHEENGSNLEFTLTSDYVGDGELVFNGSGEKDYLWIKPTSDTVDMFLRFRVYFTLGSQELDEQNADTLALLNNGNGVPEGFKLYEDESLDYELIPYDGWVYVCTINDEIIEAENKILKVVQNTTKEDKNYILSKEYRLDYDKENDEEAIFNMISLNDNQITLKVEAHAIQCFGLSDNIQDVLDETQGSNDLILDSNSEQNLEESYGSIKIKIYHKAYIEMEASKGDEENPLNIAFNEKGLLDVYTNKNLKLTSGNLVLENNTDVGQYVGNFSTLNKTYYANKSFSLITNKIKKSFKLETLFKLDSAYDFSQEQYIISMIDDSMYLKVDTAKNVIFGLKIGDEIKTLKYAILAGQFINIIVTFDGETLNMYCNSILVSTISCEGNVKISAGSNNWLLIGAKKDITVENYFNGSLAMAKISAKTSSHYDIRDSFTYSVSPDILNAQPQLDGNMLNKVQNANLEKIGAPQVSLDTALGSNVAYFNGSTHYRWYGISSYYSNISKAFTFEIFFKTNANKASGKIFANQQTSGFCLGYGSNGGWISSEIYVGGGYRSVGASIPVNTYVHVTLTYDGTYYKMYVNGILKSSINVKKYGSAITMPGSSSRYLVLSGDSGSGGGIESKGSCTISYLKMYKRALTATEVRNIKKI